MGILMGALAGGAEASLRKDEMENKSMLDRNNALAVGRQNSDLELQRQQTLETFKMKLGEQQRTAQVGRIDGAANGIIGGMQANKVISSYGADGAGLAPGDISDEEKQAFPLSDAETSKARTQAAISTGDISPKEAATLSSNAELQQIRTDAVLQGLQTKLEMATNKNEITMLLAEIKAIQGRDGKPPVGYRTTQNGDLQAIPGGPADQKLQGSFNADTAQLTGSISGFDRLASAANEVLKHPGLDGITGWRGKIPNAPGTDAANAEALLGTLKSQVGFGVLQDMRNNSKTGGALGSVSDAEGKRLESNLAALDKAQSPEQFRAQLTKIVEYSEQAKDRMRDSFNLKHRDKPTGASGDSGASAAKDDGKSKSAGDASGMAAEMRRRGLLK